MKGYTRPEAAETDLTQEHPNMNLILPIFRAYRRLVAKTGEELRLPDLKYTQNQLFWMSMASIW